MATTEQLNLLADELTQAMPPPRQLAGIQNVIPGTGRWVIVRVGGGTFAVRAQFDSPTGEPVICRTADEVRGYASTVATSLRFAIQVATASRHNWIRV